ncbi:DUF6461 domain-containing protein [Streptomyces sp. NPDC002537]
MPQDGLRWLPHSFREGFCVSFVRGVTPDGLLSRLGGITETAKDLTRAEAEEAELFDEADGSVIRAGSCGEWAYAIENWGAHGIQSEIAEAISRGTESVVIANTADGSIFFIHATNGHIVCAFDPSLPHLRSGTDPDHLIAAMENVGLASNKEPGGHALQAILQLAEEEFQISLPRQQVEHDTLLAMRISS